MASVLDMLHTKAFAEGELRELLAQSHATGRTVR
jgi:hypothetical protein